MVQKRLLYIWEYHWKRVYARYASLHILHQCMYILLCTSVSESYVRHGHVFRREYTNTCCCVLACVCPPTTAKLSADIHMYICWTILGKLTRHLQTSLLFFSRSYCELSWIYTVYIWRIQCVYKKLTSLTRKNTFAQKMQIKKIIIIVILSFSLWYGYSWRRKGLRSAF